MSFIIAEAEDVVANPLDLVEQIVIANEWPFDRQTDDEMAVEITGKFCDFRLWFAWRPETAALHLSCALDMKVPVGRRGGIYPLLAQLNDRLWLGHFDLWTEESVPLLRHTLLVRGGPLTPEHVEEVVDIAVTECERAYPAFQFVIWGGKTAEEAITAAMFETVGEA